MDIEKISSKNKSNYIYKDAIIIRKITKKKKLMFRWYTYAREPHRPDISILLSEISDYKNIKKK